MKKNLFFTIFIVVAIFMSCCNVFTPRKRLVVGVSDSLILSPTVAVTVTEGRGVKGYDKYYNTRIPVAEVANDGSLILLWQGRYDGSDRGADHLLVSRSIDNGKTWMEQRLFEENGVDLGDNSLIIDRKSGTLFAMAYVSGRLGSKQLIYSSDDHGVRWTKLNTLVRNPSGEVLRMRGTTGIQLQKGDDNTLIMPAITGSGKLAYMKCDSGSKEWTFLAEHGVMEYNEPTIVEVINTDSEQASVLNVNRINRKVVAGFKRQTFSSININTLDVEWKPGDTTEDFIFYATSCNQHLKRYSGIEDGGKSRILYSSTINGSTSTIDGSKSSHLRYGGLVAISYDEGRTWKSKIIVPRNIHFGYCSQVILKDGSIGLFYETHNDTGKKVRYGAIKFIQYSLDWLECD